MIKRFSMAFVVAVLAITMVGAGQAFAFAKLAPGKIGDALLGYVYDVRDLPEREGVPWQNYFVIQNTTNRWVAAHLRFRAQTKSIEVWDHIILLSPYDVFWAYLERKADGGVTIASQDKETLVNSGLIGPEDEGYSDDFKTTLLYQNGFGTDPVETELGELEIIGVWMVEAVDEETGVDYSSNHDITKIANNVFNGDGFNTTNVYDILYAVFGGLKGAPGKTLAPSTLKIPYNYEYQPHQYTTYYLVDAPNVLAGSMELGDTTTGQYSVYNFIALEDFRTDRPDTGGNDYHRDNLASGAIVYPVSIMTKSGATLGDDPCYWGLSIDQTAWYLNPDVNTYAGPTLRDGDSNYQGNEIKGIEQVWDPDTNQWYDTPDYVSRFNAMWSLVEVEQALAKASVWAYYMDDIWGSDLRTRVVFDFPTKYLHFFYADFPYWNGFEYGANQCAQYKNDIFNENDGGYRGGIADAWAAISNAPILVEGEMYDTEQNRSIGLFPSPIGNSDPSLPHEVNVIEIGEEGTIFQDGYSSHGQFWIDYWKLQSGQRTLADIVDSGLNNPDIPEIVDSKTVYSDTPNIVPIIGGTIRMHHYSGAAVYRSSMSDFHFKESEY